MRSVHRGIRALAGIAAVAFLSGARASSGPDHIELIFLDVGYGDALVVRSPEGKVALIDAGRGWLIGQLGVHGIDAVNIAIATHPHADHVGGMADVLHDLPVETYLDNGVPHATAIYAQVMDALDRSAATYVVASRQTLELGSVTLEVLPHRRDAASLDDGSLAVLIRFGEFSALVTGDAQHGALAHFLAMDIPRVTVLKASHHGARDGVSAEWLRATEPRAVVISVGEDNGYGHPDPSAMELYKSVANEIYRTDLHGEVTILGAVDGTYEVNTVWGDRFARSADETPLDPVQPARGDVAHIDVWVYPDAAGYDQFNLNGEYVVIKNTSGEPVPVGRWRLCNAERTCYTFPPAAAIPPSDSVFVFTGVGQARDGRFYMRQPYAVWDDRTGRAILFDHDGRVVARYAY